MLVIGSPITRLTEQHILIRQEITTSLDLSRNNTFRLYLQLFVGGFMSYLRYLYLFA
jgi:hypothetical protein